MDAEALVPNDVVLLEEGSRVPADGRLISSIDEAALLEFADRCGISLKTYERTGELRGPAAGRPGCRSITAIRRFR